MYRLNLTLVCILLCNISLGFGQKKTVVIKLNYYQPYCGGARPTKEIKDEAAKPKPYINKTVILVSSEGKVDSIKSNKTGAVKFKLRPGSYKLYEAWRYYHSTQGGSADNYDTECLKAEWQKEAFSITVSKKGAVVTEVNQIINNCEWNRLCLKNENKQVPD